MTACIEGSVSHFQKSVPAAVRAPIRLRALPSANCGGMCEAMAFNKSSWLPLRKTTPAAHEESTLKTFCSSQLAPTETLKSLQGSYTSTARPCASCDLPRNGYLSTMNACVRAYLAESESRPCTIKLKSGASKTCFIAAIEILSRFAR